MSQRQAASLLACAFFCLFPYRSDSKIKKEYANFQNPNFNSLYQRGHMQKVEKLKCILHYFERITRQSKISSLISPSIVHLFSVYWCDYIPTSSITKASHTEMVGID
jgi:hypothetical protein